MTEYRYKSNEDDFIRGSHSSPVADIDTSESSASDIETPPQYKNVPCPTCRHHKPRFGSPCNRYHCTPTSGEGYEPVEVEVLSEEVIINEGEKICGNCGMVTSNIADNVVDEDGHLVGLFCADCFTLLVELKEKPHAI